MLLRSAAQRMVLPAAAIWLLLLPCSQAARSRGIMLDIARSATLSSAAERRPAERAALKPGPDAASVGGLPALRNSSIPKPVALWDLLASAGAPVLLSGEHSAVAVGQAAEDVGFAEAYFQALAVMMAAELFDRSWFMVLICSLNHGMLVTFLSSFLALVIHSVFAVSLGQGIAYLLPKWSLELLSAVILGGFAVYYTWAFFAAEPGEDGLQDRKESARTVSNTPTQSPPADGLGEGMAEAERVLAGGSAPSGEATKKRAVWWSSFAIVFVTLFIAEWGDRTQIVQISMAASLPVLPIFLGSVTGLFFLCLSAVALAGVMEGREIDEKLLNLICGVSFGIMALLALYHACNEFAEESSAAA